MCPWQARVSICTRFRGYSGVADSGRVEGFEVTCLVSWPGEDWNRVGPIRGRWKEPQPAPLRQHGESLPMAGPLENSQFRIRARHGSQRPPDEQFADSSNVLWYVLWGTRGNYDDTLVRRAGESAPTRAISAGEWHTIVLEAGRDFRASSACGCVR